MNLFARWAFNIWAKFWSLAGWKTVLDKPKDISNYDTSGTPYDYLSIMHYTENAFAKKPSLTTIKVHDKKVI